MLELGRELGRPACPRRHLRGGAGGRHQRGVIRPRCSRKDEEICRVTWARPERLVWDARPRRYDRRQRRQAYVQLAARATTSERRPRRGIAASCSCASPHRHLLSREPLPACKSRPRCETSLRRRGALGSDSIAGRKSPVSTPCPRRSGDQHCPLIAQLRGSRSSPSPSETFASWSRAPSSRKKRRRRGHGFPSGDSSRDHGARGAETGWASCSASARMPNRCPAARSTMAHLTEWASSPAGRQGTLGTAAAARPRAGGGAR